MASGLVPKNNKSEQTLKRRHGLSARRIVFSVLLLATSLVYAGLMFITARDLD
jgi:hypothetical protein